MVFAKQEPKRYIVFAGYNYYPGGGMEDCILTTDDMEEARKAGAADRGDWAHVYDTQTGETIDIG